MSNKAIRFKFFVIKKKNNFAYMEYQFDYPII